MSLKKYSESEAFSAFKTVRNYIRRFYPEELIFECILRLNSHYWKNINAFRQYPPWFLLLIIKWTILYGDYLSPDRKKLEVSHFNKLINLIHDLDSKMRLPNEYSNYFIFLKNLSFQQFWLQEEFSFSKIARQKIIFGNLVKSHTFQKEFHKKTKLSINDFIELSLMLLAKFRQDRNEPFITEEWFKNVSSTYSWEKIHAFLNLLSKDIESLKLYLKKNKNRYRSISYEFYEQSPLQRYPFLYYSGKYFCYSPVVLNNTIQNYIYDTLRENDPQKFMSKFGPIFESYVEKIINYGGYNYYTENDLKKILPSESKKVDFIIHSKKSLILIDAKGVEMGNLGKVSHLSEVIVQQTKTSVIKGIQQAIETIAQLNHFDYSHVLYPKDKEIYLFLITFKDLYLGNGSDFYEFVGREKINNILYQYQEPPGLKMKNIYIFSIDDFEVLIQCLLQNNINITDFMAEIVQADSKFESKKLILRQHIFEKFKDIEMLDFQKEEFQKIFDKIKFALTA